MPVTRYIDRLRRMDDLIRKRATGPPDEFAKRLGIKKSTLMIYLKEAKELGAPVMYCRDSQTYYYGADVYFTVSYSEQKIND